MGQSPGHHGRTVVTAEILSQNPVDMHAPESACTDAPYGHFQQKRFLGEEVKLVKKMSDTCLTALGWASVSSKAHPFLVWLTG